MFYLNQTLLKRMSKLLKNTKIVLEELMKDNYKAITCKTFCRLSKRLPMVDTPTFHERLCTIDTGLKLLKRNLISLTNIEYVTGIVLNFKAVVKDKLLKFVKSFELANFDYF